MRRITKLVGIGALGFALVTGTGTAIAAGPTDAPGQETAWEKCIANVEKQLAEGTEAGGGPKTGISEAPSNCDHFWQVIGAIGDH